MAANKTRAVRPRNPGETQTAYPALDGPKNPGRRRFLRQLAAGSGAVGLVSGSAGILHAQSGPETDFTILDAHEPVAAAVEEPAPTRRRAARQEQSDSAAVEERQDSSETTAVEEVWLTENRALWVEPGYLVLVRWRRPEANETVVAALEGSAEAVAIYLSEVVTDPQGQLHDVEAVSLLEAGILAVLSETTGPAAIEALHLDHDCRIVCPAPEIDPPQVRGRMVPPGR